MAGLVAFSRLPKAGGRIATVLSRQSNSLEPARKLFRRGEVANNEAAGFSQADISRCIRVASTPVGMQVSLVVTGTRVQFIMPITNPCNGGNGYQWG